VRSTAAPALWGNLGWADILAGQHVQPGRVTAGFSGAKFAETTLKIPPLEGNRPVTLEDQELQAVRQGAARLTQALGKSGTHVGIGADFIGQDRRDTEAECAKINQILSNV
jgi:hypothetical protein